MKTVLFGANGQLGSDIVACKPASVELVALTRRDVDVTQQAQVRQLLLLHEPEVVINGTAFHQMDRCEEDPQTTFQVNATAVRDLAGVCREIGATLLHVSTDYVFGGGADRTRPYTEDEPPCPLNTYGISKVAGEHFARSALDSHYIVRVSSLFGKAGASGKGGNFVYTMLRLARDGQPMRVIDDISMSPTYAKEAATEVWRLLTQGVAHGTYHIAGQGVCTWYEFTKKILDLAALTADLTACDHTQYPTKARRPLFSALTSSKGTRMRPWQEGLHDFLKEIDAVPLAASQAAARRYR